MKVGDPVIVYKPIWMNHKPKSGIINEIFEYDNKPVYRVYFYDEMGKYKEGCNIFQGETIELDVITIRDRKIKELGI